MVTKCYNISMGQPFLYGAATSAHQTEGNNVHNDWWAWEMGRPIEMRSGLAADHYDRFREDFRLAKELGHNAHRFSLEWSRIEPKRGRWDKQALGHYRHVLEELKKLEITPFVTLHHFTNPRWFAERGGWLRSDAAELFTRYVQTAADYLGDLVPFWITLNEPVLWSSLAYWQRRWPPQQRSLIKFNRSVHHLAVAHNQAYQVLHRKHAQTQVGLARNLVAYQPASESWLDRVACQTVDWWFNRRFYNMTWPQHDFLGINYYFQTKIHWETKSFSIVQSDTQGERSDVGWTIAPDGLRQVLESVRRYKCPVYVTENGLADRHDKLRADFIRDHLRAVERAQESGVDVRGYFHWSLLDNYEWDLGVTPRFGLVAVDYKTMSRSIRPSAYVYKSIIEQARGG
ncbi:MAG TPA: glycosyl transferase [Candidatus Andersenbacteria bacterium]|nr:MAG: Beta-glucosidase [Parcubacteria group bacterium GW2011_GWA2_45_14]HBE90955.1 glycosyl transferase [Candidatus Andersenbacteria bacterium]